MTCIENNIIRVYVYSDSFCLYKSSKMTLKAIFDYLEWLILIYIFSLN